jgi:hypothetical protein
MQIELRALRDYLQTRHDKTVTLRQVQKLGGEMTGAAALKAFGYGDPLLVEYGVDGEIVREVFHRIRRTPFGRERDDDRVAAVWFDYVSFNQLARHVPAQDMLILNRQGRLATIGNAEELVLVTGYRPGHIYANDLVALRDGATLTPKDVRRAELLAVYLAEVHQTQHEDPTLWRRRLRDLVGHGEGVMGLTDSYPSDLAYIDTEMLRAIEAAANDWRWRLKPRSHRLAQVHGDFHPFNIIFHEQLEFYVLDRSRGMWGEPADDVSCLAVNYLFFSLQRYGRLDGPFRDLYDRFWYFYFLTRPDEELVEVIQPWFAWRILVLASPLWYPDIDDEVRRKLINFARNVLDCKAYDYQNPNPYFEEP